MYYNELYHYGIPGMKWGVRRFQNANGSYTPLGARRHSAGVSGAAPVRGSSGSSGRRKIDKRKLARNIAIGVGAAAAIGGAAYGIHRLRKNRQNFVGPSKMSYYADKGQAAIDKASTKLASRIHIDEPFNADGSFNSNPKKKASGFAEAVRRGERVMAERKAKSRTNDPLSKAMKNDATVLKKARKQYTRNKLHEVGDFSYVSNSPKLARELARDYDLNRARTAGKIAAAAAIPVGATAVYRIRKSGQSKKSRRGKHS